MVNESAYTVVIDKSLLSTALSALVFVASVYVSTNYLQTHETDATVTSSVSLQDTSDDDGNEILVDDEAEEDESERYYLHRRLEHRLSFPRFAAATTATTTADDERTIPGKLVERSDGILDFNPKNSNWHHFECTSVPKDPTSSPIIFPRKKPTLTMRESLDGDIVNSRPGSFYSTSIKEEKTAASDDEEYSLTSADHFVWTEAQYSPKQRAHQIRQLNEQQQHRHSNIIKSDMEYNAKGVGPTTLPTLPPSVARRSISSPFPQQQQEDDQSSSARAAARVRANYNARIMPNKVVLVRHGQSEGNINELLYSTTPDNAIPLTKLGWDQARAAGKRLKYDVLPQNCKIHFIVSPYVRTVETFHGMVSAWCEPTLFDHIPDRNQRMKAWYSKLLEMGITWAEDVRIREQVN